jgi:ActR/RegA family two-component response regulator
VIAVDRLRIRQVVINLVDQRSSRRRRGQRASPGAGPSPPATVIASRCSIVAKGSRTRRASGPLRTLLHHPARRHRPRSGRLLWSRHRPRRHHPRRAETGWRLALRDRPAGNPRGHRGSRRAGARHEADGARGRRQSEHACHARQGARQERRVLTARGVRTALQLLEKEAITVVLCDLRMNDGDGLEVLRAVRSRWPGVAFILMTAYATVPTAVQAMREGAYRLRDEALRSGRAARPRRAGAGAVHRAWTRTIRGPSPERARRDDRPLAGHAAVYERIERVAPTDATLCSWESRARARSSRRAPSTSARRARRRASSR